MNLQSILNGDPAADHIRLRIKRVLIIIGVLAFSAVAGLAAKYGLLALGALLVMVAGLAGLYFADRFGRVEYGILALVPLATLVNFVTLPTGRGSRLVFSLVLALGLVGLWVFQVWFSKGRVRLQKAPVNLPLILFVTLSIVAYIWSELLRDPFLVNWDHFMVVRAAALLVNVLLPMLALFIGGRITEVRWLKWIVLLLLGIGTFVLVSQIGSLPFSSLYFNGTRGLFATWVAAMALALGLFDEEYPLWARGGVLILSAAWFAYSFLQNTIWLSGWLPMGVAGAMVILLRSRKWFLVLIAALLVIGISQYNWIVSNIIDTNLAEGSGNRLQLWLLNFDLILNHPLFGVGPAGYAPYYMTYHPTTAMSTHNNYFDVLAQTGFIGFFVFLWMMVAFLALGLRVRRALTGKRNFEEAFINGALGGLIAALVSMMLGDWVLPFAYNQTISGFDNAMFTWLFMGGILAMYFILKARGDIDPAPDPGNAVIVPAENQT